MALAFRFPFLRCAERISFQKTDYGFLGSDDIDNFVLNVISSNEIVYIATAPVAAIVVVIMAMQPKEAMVLPVLLQALLSSLLFLIHWAEHRNSA